MRNVIALPHRIGTPALRVAVALAGTGILTLSSYIQVPMFPVPMTMQTLAVTLVGAMLGPRLGAATVLAWLAAAFAGLPVLAGDHITGPAAFVGLTAGYLFAFPLAAGLAGALIQAGWTSPVRAFAVMLAGNALILFSGWAWLVLPLGAHDAFVFGVAPFAFGAVLKAGIGATIIRLLAR